MGNTSIYKLLFLIIIYFASFVFILGLLFVKFYACYLIINYLFVFDALHGLKNKYFLFVN